MAVSTPTSDRQAFYLMDAPVLTKPSDNIALQLDGVFLADHRDRHLCHPRRQSPPYRSIGYRLSLQRSVEPPP